MGDAPDRIWAAPPYDDPEWSTGTGEWDVSSAWAVTPLVEYTRADLAPTDAQVMANEKVRALVEAVDGAATIANGALDSTATEATFRRDLVRIRNGLRAALRDLEAP